MWWYVGKRLLQAIPVVLGATLLIYAMVFLQPGDPITALFGEKPVSETARANLEAQYNLDKPFLVQWLLFLGGALTGDLGTSYSGQPVADLIGRTFPVTVKLALMALIIEAVLGIIAGFWAGRRRGKIFDSTMLVVSLLVIAVPIFVFGFTMQLIFGVKLGWAPVTVGGDASLLSAAPWTRWMPVPCFLRTSAMPSRVGSASAANGPMAAVAATTHPIMTPRMPHLRIRT